MPALVFAITSVMYNQLPSENFEHQPDSLFILALWHIDTDCVLSIDTRAAA